MGKLLDLIDVNLAEASRREELLHQEQVEAERYALPASKERESRRRERASTPEALAGKAKRREKAKASYKSRRHT